MTPIILSLMLLADEQADFWVAGNPMALVTSIPSKPVKIITPILSNMEFGLALSGGMFIGSHQGLEGRFSVGTPHDFGFSLMPQASVGWSWFFRAFEDERSRGPYAGIDVRIWDLVYWTTSYDYWSIMPAFHLGWWFGKEPFFINLRWTQIVGACSWSSQPGTSGACEAFLSPSEGMTPILPLLSVDLGWTFK